MSENYKFGIKSKDFLESMKKNTYKLYNPNPIHRTPNTLITNTKYLLSRKALFYMLHKICDIFHFKSQTYFLSLQYLDIIFNENPHFSNIYDNYDVLALTCLILATKFTENDLLNPTISDFLKEYIKNINRNKILINDIIYTEVKICKILGYKLNYYTIFDFNSFFFANGIIKVHQLKEIYNKIIGETKLQKNILDSEYIKKLYEKIYNCSRYYLNIIIFDQISIRYDGFILSIFIMKKSIQDVLINEFIQCNKLNNNSKIIMKEEYLKIQINFKDIFYNFYGIKYDYINQYQQLIKDPNLIKLFRKNKNSNDNKNYTSNDNKHYNYNKNISKINKIKPGSTEKYHYSNGDNNYNSANIIKSKTSKIISSYDNLTNIEDIYKSNVKISTLCNLNKYKNNNDVNSYNDKRKKMLYLSNIKKYKRFPYTKNLLLSSAILGRNDELYNKYSSSKNKNFNISSEMLKNDDISHRGLREMENSNRQKKTNLKNSNNNELIEENSNKNMLNYDFAHMLMNSDKKDYNSLYSIKYNNYLYKDSKKKYLINISSNHEPNEYYQLPCYNTRNKICSSINNINPKENYILSSVNNSADKLFYSEIDNYKNNYSINNPKTTNINQYNKIIFNNSIQKYKNTQKKLNVTKNRYRTISSNKILSKSNYKDYFNSLYQDNNYYNIEGKANLKSSNNLNSTTNNFAKFKYNRLKESIIKENDNDRIIQNDKRKLTKQATYFNQNLISENNKYININYQSKNKNNGNINHTEHTNENAFNNYSNKKNKTIYGYKETNKLKMNKEKMEYDIGIKKKVCHIKKDSFNPAFNSSAQQYFIYNFLES